MKVLASSSCLLWSKIFALLELLLPLCLDPPTPALSLGQRKTGGGIGSRRGIVVQLQFCFAGASCSVCGSPLQVIELLCFDKTWYLLGVMLYITTEWVHWKNAFSLQFRQARCTCVVHVAQLMSSSALSCSVSCWGALRCCVLFAETDGVKEQLWAKGTLQSCTGLASHTCLWGEQAQRWYCSIIYPFVLLRASSNVVWVLFKS